MPLWFLFLVQTSTTWPQLTLLSSIFFLHNLAKFVLQKGIDPRVAEMTDLLDCFIYILDSSNSSSFTFWSSQFATSSRSNWNSIWIGNSNGTWTDQQTSHFSTAKEISVKARESQKEYSHKQSRIVSNSLLDLLHMTNLYGAPYHCL